MNGHHLGYFNLVRGNCSVCAKGGFGCWPNGDYVPGRCNAPTQDVYHVPPEWLRRASAENELLVWNAVKGGCTPSASAAGGSQGAPAACAKQNGAFPPAVANPSQASVVMRTLGG